MAGAEWATIRRGFEPKRPDLLWQEDLPTPASARRDSAEEFISADPGKQNAMPIPHHVIDQRIVPGGVGHSRPEGKRGAGVDFFERRNLTQVNMQPGPSPLCLDLFEPWTLVPVRLAIVVIGDRINLWRPFPGVQIVGNVGERTAGRLLSATSVKVGNGFRLALPTGTYYTWKGSILE
jgi:hypothetical protein